MTFKRYSLLVGLVGFLVMSYIKLITMGGFNDSPFHTSTRKSDNLRGVLDQGVIILLVLELPGY